MKTGYTHIAVLIDKSGSMSSLKTDVINGFNGFISDQKAAPGEATLSLSQFNTDYEETLSFIDIHKVSNLAYNDFIPYGGTALNDSLSKLIKKTGEQLALKPADERPSGVIFLVITDGDDNASSVTDAEIKEMVKHQQDIYSWKFVYIGANVDAKKEQVSRGFSESISFNATSDGIKSMSRKMSASSLSYRAR